MEGAGNRSKRSNEKGQDYSMGGDLDGELERVVGNGVLLTGPLLDHVLWDIGMGMYEKLRRGHLTHLAPPLTTSMAVQMFNMDLRLSVRGKDPWQYVGRILRM